MQIFWHPLFIEQRVSGEVIDFASCNLQDWFFAALMNPHISGSVVKPIGWADTRPMPPNSARERGRQYETPAG
jgi:hypothetical protein